MFVGIRHIRCSEGGAADMAEIHVHGSGFVSWWRVVVS